MSLIAAVTVFKAPHAGPLSARRLYRNCGAIRRKRGVRRITVTWLKREDDDAVPFACCKCLHRQRSEQNQ